MKLISEVKSNLPVFKKDWFFIASLIAALAAVVLSVAFLIIFWKHIPPQIPFFYSLPWGEEQLGQPLMLIGLLLGMVMLFILNTLAALVIYTSSQFLSHMLLLGAASFSILTTITLVHIIILIT